MHLPLSSVADHRSVNRRQPYRSKAQPSIRWEINDSLCIHQFCILHATCEHFYSRRLRGFRSLIRIDSLSGFRNYNFTAICNKNSFNWQYFNMLEGKYQTKDSYAYGLGLQRSSTAKKLADIAHIDTF